MNWVLKVTDYTAEQILTAFKNLAFSRKYTQKVVGDYRYEEPRKRIIGHSIKLWGTKERGKYMDIHDTRNGKRELIPTSPWIKIK